MAPALLFPATPFSPASDLCYRKSIIWMIIPIEIPNRFQAADLAAQDRPLNQV
jgi:hypothetical protein